MLSAPQRSSAESSIVKLGVGQARCRAGFIPANFYLLLSFGKLKVVLCSVERFRIESS